MNCRFRQIVVIGCGTIAYEVLRYVAELEERYKYEVLCIEHEVHSLSKLERFCREACIGYEQIPDKRELTLRLLRLQGNALIISAGNYYIFPRAVIDKSGMEIINFHNALLPKLPGRNAPTWAIYLDEKKSGATWHYVTAEIDNGAILSQEEVNLTGDIKAYELSRDIMEAAFKGFREFYEILLSKKIDGKNPQCAENRKIYYSYEIPANGSFSLEMAPDHIYRLLRAVDYGKNQIFPPLRFYLKGNREAQVIRYAKTKGTYCRKVGDIIYDSEKPYIYVGLTEESELKIKYTII